ncbi:Retrovirus-related Pol polyprotein from transposon RE2 [Sesamum angolense]|uniref:Retrovirus-related Pol polyprotein from transposon RE2 n=1 Tax=Sesamum angolense TaxID=2727404 RepID=A0AAE1X1P9_9LAMI|nr:Retrovirus-related Pol polyprotein from transposon RE2 [Sesamum angolense]
MLDIDLDKWFEAMKSEMDSIGSNQVWTLVDPSKSIKPVRCKCVYEHMLGTDGNATTFTAKLVAKVEEIYMDQSEGFTSFREEQKGYNFIKNESDPCVYKTISESSVLYLMLYMDDILLTGNDVKMLGDTNAWLSTQFSMKDMGEASYILGIKIYQDRSRRMHGIKLSKKQSPRLMRSLNGFRYPLCFSRRQGPRDWASRTSRLGIEDPMETCTKYWSRVSPAGDISRLCNFSGIIGSDSKRLVLGLEESWQSRKYENRILDMASGGCVMRHGHHKFYPVQSEYVARTVDSKKEFVPCRYMTESSPMHFEMV